MIRFLRILSLYFQHVFQYRARNFMWFIISFINPLVLLLFWQGILANRPQVGIWNAELIFSYYLVLIITQSLLWSHVEYELALGDIKRGDLLRELLKPQSFIKMRFVADMPWRVLQGSYGIISILALTYFFSHPIVLVNDWVRILLVVMVWISAYLIGYFFKMTLGFIAFWITNIDGVLDTNDVMTIVLAGLILPNDLFPQWLQTFANFTPYPYVSYYPVTAALGLFNSTELLRLLGVQMAWVLGLGCLTIFMFKKGLKQFTGVGQ